VTIIRPSQSAVRYPLSVRLAALVITCHQHADAEQSGGPRNSPVRRCGERSGFVALGRGGSQCFELGQCVVVLLPTGEALRVDDVAETGQADLDVVD
jgi:hypothetical protein